MAKCVATDAGFVVANEALEVKGTRMSIASLDLDFGAALHFSDVAIVGSLQCP